MLAEVEPRRPETVEIAALGGDVTTFERVGRARFELHGQEATLDLYWLEAYGGGLFLPFPTRPAGSETYGGGRYLLDTVKGADLGAGRRPAGAGLQPRLQPLLRLRPALGLPARAAGQPAAVPGTGG